MASRVARWFVFGHSSRTRIPFRPVVDPIIHNPFRNFALQYHVLGGHTDRIHGLRFAQPFGHPCRRPYELRRAVINFMKGGLSLSSWSKAWADSTPITLAYVPISMTFGVIATSHGIAPLLAILISAMIYAGGAQFVFISLALTNASAWSTVLTVLIVNARHLLYGTTLGPSFSQWTEKHKWLAAFGMTDEVFAYTSSRNRGSLLSPHYQLAFEAYCYLAWMLGTVLGSTLGPLIPRAIASPLSFLLPALFLALIVLGPRTTAHLAAAVIGGATAIAVTPQAGAGGGIISGAVLGAGIGMMINFRGKKGPRPSV